MGAVVFALTGWGQYWDEYNRYKNEDAEGGLLPQGIESNRRYVGEAISWNGVSEVRQWILLDPQTSGGLLISLPEEDAKQLSEDLEAEGFSGRLIGRVRPLGQVHIEVE